MDRNLEMPADIFVDQAIAALVAGDATVLRRLEAGAPKVIAPRSLDGFLSRINTFRALLDQTGRNLRFLRRVLERQPSTLYSPSQRSI